MKLPLLVMLASVSLAVSARAQLAGEYANKQYLGGNAVFSMSIEGGGNKTAIWFSAGRNDGQGAAPEGKGYGKETGKGTLEFSFDDSCKNAGTGTVTKSGDDIIVSMKLTRTVARRSLALPITWIAAEMIGRARLLSSHLLARPWAGSAPPLPVSTH